MDPERWKQLDSLLQSALERPRDQREAFVRAACAGDQSLESELRSLLQLAREAGSFLENPAMDVAARAIGRLSVSELSPGQIVSHYRIVEKLGAGGMGMVYKAEDVRLHRFVALKFPLADIAQDPRALSRFEREARAASALNHANICTIYEVEDHQGSPVIVMELLEGESLKQRLRHGPLPADEIIDLGIQMCGALEAAHSKGIIHRDIKPANIFLTGRPARAKILDFGLAKPAPFPSHRAGPGETGATQTIEHELTSEGSAPGTIPYMSPEQVRARDLDTRTDLFSLGVVLYEMATARLPFRGESTGVIFDAILNRPPAPAASLAPNLPAELERIIGKCLEKDRALRYQHAAEIAADLERLKRDSQSGPLPIGPAPGPTRAARPWKIALPAAAALAVLLAAAYFYLHRGPRLTDKDTLVLADFVNRTGDPVFDGTLRQGLAVQLEQSPFLSLVSDQRIGEVLGEMRRPKDAPLTPALAKDVCERASAAAVLDGSIAPLGSRYVVGLRARNCRTGDVLDEEQVQAAKKEDVLNALTQIAGAFRQRVGESLATVRKYDKPLEEATTPSLEALKAYSLAFKVAYSTGFANGLPLLRQAVELDPKFARAYAQLAMFYPATGDLAHARESILKAYELRNRATEPEKAFIIANYDVQITGNLEEAHQICESWVQAYPRDKRPHGLLSALIDEQLGRYDESLEQAKIALAIDPDFTPGYSNQVWSNLYLSRVDDAEKALQQAVDRKLEIEDMVALRYYIAFLKDDRAGMQSAVEQARGKPGVEDWLLDEEAFGLASSGHVREAGALAGRAAAMARQANHPGRAALYQVGTAVRQALFGYMPEARRNALAALQEAPDKEVKYGAGFALALSGDAARAQSLAAELEKAFPQDTVVRFTYVPTLRAAASLQTGDPAKALDLLQAGTYDFALPGTWAGFFGMMYPVYIRGSALLAAGKPAEAAAELMKILKHPGLLFHDPVGPATRLQIARALVQAGKAGEAKAAYQDFLNRWESADPDIPILKAARAEYARLP